MAVSTCNGNLTTWPFANVKQTRLGFLSTDSKEKEKGNAATTWLCKYR